MCFEQYSFQHLKSLNTSQNSNLNTSNAHLHQDLHLHNQELQFKYSYTLQQITINNYKIKFTPEYVF